MQTLLEKVETVSSPKDPDWHDEASLLLLESYQSTFEPCFPQCASAGRPGNILTQAIAVA